MPAVSELELPSFNHTDSALSGEPYREAMAGLEGYDGWLAANPFGYTVLDREAGEFFLRSRELIFPGLLMAEIFGITDGPLHEEFVNNIITKEGTDHRRLRQLVNPALSQRAVERYRPAMRGFAEQLLGQVPASGETEFVADFAKPYPSLVIAEVMGAPLEDAPRLHYWSNMIQRQFDAESVVNDRQAIEEAVSEFYEYEDALIEARRQTPADDLITALIQAESEGDPQAGEAGGDPQAGGAGGDPQAGGAGRDRLTDNELRNLVLNILVGGVDTSQSQLAHAVRLLAEYPDQWQALRSDPQGLALAAVDEAVRYEPITPFTARMTVDELEYRGVTFPPNTLVLVSAWHANRDGVAGDEFDILADRGRARVLTFGAGIHFCVGQNLARTEMQEAVAFLAERVSSLSLAGEPVFGTPAGIYQLERLPLRIELA